MKKIYYILAVSLVIIGFLIGYGATKKNNKSGENIIPSIVEKDFNLKVLKTVNAYEKDKNYLISPYSIEVALNMLKEGANGNTYKEINDLVGDRKINDIITDKVKVANAVFIKNEYKDNVREEFKNTLVNDYHAETIFDDFYTPDVINEWGYKKTDGMITKVVDSISKDFVLGVANAIAIDVKWTKSFDCVNTRGEKFTNGNKEINVEMMNKTFGAGVKYFITDNEQGVVLQYDNDLEFIGILPTGDLKTYIDGLTADTLSNIESNIKTTDDNTELLLSLPRFKYSFDLESFIGVLESMGIKDAFNPKTADFSKMLTGINGYISQAVHKTYIDLNEVGTKAAAITFFAVDKSSAIIRDEKEKVNIKFNKPFMYIIRNTKNNEMLFAGTVYEPNKWQGSTCDNYE